MQFSTQHGPPRPPGTTSATRSEAFCSAEQGFWGGCRGVSRTGPQPSAVAAWPTARLEAGGRPKGLWRAPDRRGWRTDRQRYTLKIRRQRHERSARERARERESHLKPCKSSGSSAVCRRGRVTWPALRYLRAMRFGPQAPWGSSAGAGSRSGNGRRKGDAQPPAAALPRNWASNARDRNFAC